MFKNPLKYQQGGAAPSQEEQQVLAAFIQWLPKRVKEFQGMQPEQIAQTLDGMSKTPEGKKQLQQLMSQFQQEMQGGSQAFRQGGKIHDFICKHAKGGKAGCGCKQEGGEIENKKPGYSVREQRYPNGQLAGRDEYANGMVRSSLNPDSTDKWYWMGEEGTPFAIEPESQRSRGPISGTKYVNQTYWNWINNQMDMARKYGTLDYKENGGKVLKGQHGLSSGRFNIPFGAYMKAYFNKRRTPDVGAATKRSFGYSTTDGNEYYLEDANVGRNSVDTWVNVTPQKDTVIMQKLPSNHINNLEDYQMEAIMQRMRPDIKRVNNQKIGGKIEKHQRGSGQLGKTYVQNNPDEFIKENVDPNTLVKYSPVVVAYPNGEGPRVEGNFWEFPYMYDREINNRRSQSEINEGLLSAKEFKKKYTKNGWMYESQDLSYDPLREYGHHYKVQSIYPADVEELGGFGGDVDAMYTIPGKPDTMIVGYPVYRTIGRDSVRNTEPGFEAARNKWFEIINNSKTKPIPSSNPWTNNAEELRKERNKSNISKKENGGKVEKAQDGNILDFYKNKWKNDFFD